MEISSGISNNWSWMIKELTQGRDFAKQLQNHLHPSTPHETREFLIDKILSTYNRALHVATLPAATSQINFRGGGSPESSVSASGVDAHRRPSKKRKATPRWIKTMTVTGGGGGPEGLVSDGYNWRKYGQKDILGAAFPRNYYRCTHRHTQSCPATKQVQKSDDDSTTFQVIYKGHHTCSQSTHHSRPSPNPLLASTRPKPNRPGPKQEHHNHSQQLGPNQRSTTLVQPQPTVGAEGALSFRSFSFSSAFLEADGAELPDTWLVTASPATSDSIQLFGGSGTWTPDSDINDHGASGSDSPTGQLDFTLDALGIDPNFPFDSPEIFSWIGSD